MCSSDLGLRPPKRRPLGEPAGAPRAPGARPRGRSSCPPPHAVVVPERAAGLRWVGGAAAALPAGPPCAAVCGWGYRVRCPCRRAAARAVCRALWGSPPAPSNPVKNPILQQWFWPNFGHPQCPLHPLSPPDLACTNACPPCPWTAHAEPLSPHHASPAPDRKSTRLNSSHITRSRMPSSA